MTPEPAPAQAPRFVTPLKDLCVREVANAFQKSSLEDVPPAHHAQIVDLLPLDLPLELAGQSIKQETYWKQRSTARWTNCDPVKHGMSYKQLYFERNLQDTIEEFDSEICNVDDLKRLLAFSARFVQTLTLVQLPSHLDLDILFDGLGNSLTQLSVCYGMRDVGMDYDRSIFGMKLSDCRSMARCLEYSETLVSLNLSGNLLDDDKLRMLASGLVNNLSVAHIDLGHNKIADRGVRAFAKLLHTSSVIQVVNLENNQIHSEGGRALARALRTNTSMCSLNLSMNRLGEEGGRAIFDVLRHHPSLTHLGIAHNALGPLTATAIAKFASANAVLKELDISGAALGGEGGAAIRDAVSSNATLEHLAATLSGMTQSDILALQDTLHTRAEARARQRFAKARK